MKSSPGKGSAFYFTLPEIIVKTTLKSIYTVLEAEFNFTGKTILIAEDDDASYTLLRMLLKRTGAILLRGKGW